jgi:glycosyltransferase involved in cell wall biosynthesis
MKILYLHQYFTTLNGAGGSRSYEFARRWVQGNHKVHVVTGHAFDPTLPKNGDFEIEGIKVTAVGITYKAEMGFFKRLKVFTYYGIKSTFIAMRGKDYDIVLATSTPLTVALPALAAKWIAGRLVIFEVRDVWPDAAVEAGVLKNAVAIGLAKMLEKAAYACAAHIVPLSNGMLKRIAEKGVNLSKMTMIPNCSDTSNFHPGIDGNFLRKQYKAEDKFIVLYAGAVNLANNVEYLIDVAQILADKDDIEIWIIGNGNRYEFIESQVRKRELNNICLFGKQPKNKIPYYAATADVGVVTFIPQPVYYENSPNKFFDYIAAGLPVLFNRTTWLEDYLEEYQNGYICDPQRPQSMAKHILALKNDFKKRTSMGVQSRRLAEEVFSRDAMSAKYLKLFQSVLKTNH